MTAYIVRRLAQALLVLFIVSLLVFLLMHLLPGDPILIYLSEQDVENLTPEQIAYYRHQFGLDKPLPVQYVNWIADLLHGDFGISVNYHEDVGKLLAERLPVTIHLGLLALLLASIFGILTGVLAALRRGKWLDTVMTLLANIGITIPVFWLGILMIYGIGLELRWLPICGYTSPFEDFWLSTKQVIMPVLCLAVFALASTARQTRSSMLEVIRQDYIRTAWAKGLRIGPTRRIKSDLQCACPRTRRREDLNSLFPRFSRKVCMSPWAKKWSGPTRVSGLSLIHI